MNDKGNIKTIQLFESYPDFYQPYIPPLIEALSKSPNLDLQIQAFKGKCSKDVNVMPNYYKRRLLERWYSFVNSYHVKLQYNEIQALKHDIDIIHVQHSFLFTKVLGLLQHPQKKRPKIIITLRGADTYVKPWINEKWSSFYKRLGNKVDAFVVMSNHQKEYLSKKWHIENERIHVVPISFGLSFKEKPKKPNREHLKIVSIFRMCWEKNIEGNLRVIKHLKSKGLPVKYYVYGDGPDIGQLYYLVDKFDLNDDVFIQGKVANNQLRQKLKNYDFVLQLSSSESLGMSVIEAQALGLPAIVSDSDGLPETINANLSGYSVNSNDAQKAAEYIKTLWYDRDMYHRFSIKAIEHAHTNYSIENEVSKLLELYQKFKT